MQVIKAEATKLIESGEQVRAVAEHQPLTVVGSLGTPRFDDVPDDFVAVDLKAPSQTSYDKLNALLTELKQPLN